GGDIRRKNEMMLPLEVFYFFSFYLFLLYCLYMALGFDRNGGRETKNNIFYGCCGFGLSCGGGCGQFR
ncbi:hypothetical protein, partial [Escherichia sp. TW09276]|uniref:hypothetical protein n=1 Tax=Escherichia sp. TW09276 TaxID=754330 RepID=UPI001ED95887